MIDISNPTELRKKLEELTPEVQPKFGMMTPQHMVEHLALVVEYSNGKQTAELQKSEETAIRWKQALIYTDYEMQPGVRAPFVPENTLLALKHSDLQESIDQLIQELKDFEKFFEKNPQKEVMHPALGMLNYDEWKIFHTKHFAHHFRQFGLM